MLLGGGWGVGEVGGGGGMGSAESSPIEPTLFMMHKSFSVNIDSI